MNSVPLLFYTEVKMVFGLINIFFQQRCHCEREQRAKQSAKYVFDFCLLAAVFQVIVAFSAKQRPNSAHAWQIASLVALARNDSRLL